MSLKLVHRPLGDLCEVISGQSPSSTNYNSEGLGLPFYQGKKDFTARLLGEPKVWTEEVTKEANAGDIVMSVRAPVGPVNEVGERICIGRGLAAIRHGPELMKDFLWYQLLSLEGSMSGNAGAVFSSISRKDIEAIQLALCTLEEQQAIVDILDEAFAGLEKARANAEANLENAGELFQSALTVPFANKTDQVPLKELADANYGYTASAEHNVNGLKFLRITDIQNGSVNWDKVPSCTITVDNKIKHSLLPNDIVFARTGATTGKSYLIEDKIDAVAASYLIRLRIKDGRVRPRFLYAYFQSSAYWREVTRGIEGSTQGGFNASKLGKLAIPIVSLEEQDLIAEQLSRTQEETDRLQEEYKRQLSDLDELKQSLLQKAFAGELT